MEQPSISQRFNLLQACVPIYLLILVFILNGAVAQEKTDSTKRSATKKAFMAGLKMVSTNPNDTIVNVASVDNFAQFAGKTIRHIYVERIGFEKSIYDT